MILEAISLLPLYFLQVVRPDILSKIERYAISEDSTRWLGQRVGMIVNHRTTRSCDDEGGPWISFVPQNWSSAEHIKLGQRPVKLLISEIMLNAWKVCSVGKLLNLRRACHLVIRWRAIDHHTVMQRHSCTMWAWNQLKESDRSAGSVWVLSRSNETSGLTMMMSEVSSLACLCDHPNVCNFVYKYQ